MRITIIVNPTSPWSPEDYDNGLLAGSEEMVVLFARELSKKGHDVVVYCSCHSQSHTDVLFDHGKAINYFDLSLVANKAHQGILIAFKEPKALNIDGFEKRYLWTADCTTLSVQQRRVCDGLFAISEWHKRELKGCNPGYIDIESIRPGIPVNKTQEFYTIPKQCLYASSHDRGLKYLLAIWPEILAHHPTARLKVTYGKTDLEPVEGVDFLGKLSNEDMDTLYKTSDVLAYPCSGQERYCIVAAKAQIYGAIPCVVPHMALQNVVQFGKKFLKKDYLQGMIELLANTSERAAIRSDMTTNVDFNTWADVVNIWEKILER